MDLKRNLLRKILTSFIIFCIIFSLGASHALSCTRIFWWDNPYEYIVGRTMDWMEDTRPEIWIYPAKNLATQHQSDLLLPHSLEGELPSSQQETYGMIALTAYGEMTVDGLNEKGLAGHVLYLGGTRYNTEGSGKISLASKNWLHHILESYASVSEVIENAQHWRLNPSTVDVHEANIHLALEDKTGDSTILEYKDGLLHVFRGSSHGVLTNAPFYGEHLQGLSRYQVFGGEELLPKSDHSHDRFVKATYGLSQLAPASNESVNIDSMKKLLTSISVNRDDSKTYYHTVTNLSHGTFSFHDIIKDEHYSFSVADINFQGIHPQGGKRYPLG